MSANLFEYFIPIIEKYKCGILTCDHFIITEVAYHNYLPIEAPKSKKEKLTNINSIQYLENLSSENDHKFKNACVLWNKLIDKSYLTNFQFDTTKQIPNPFAIKKLLLSDIPIINSNQQLIATAPIDFFFEEISFDYNELEKIEFLQNLLVYFKGKNNTKALKNISIKLLDLLYKIRIKLNNYYTDIYDLEEQKENINKKFNSVRKFLKSRYPDNSQEYSHYFTKYEKILNSEKFIENHPDLYPHPPKDFQIPISVEEDNLQEESKTDEQS